MLARLNANKYLLQNEEGAKAVADKAFTDLTSVLQALDVATKGADFRRTFDEMQSGVATYRDAYRKSADLEAAINDMVNRVMGANAQQIQANTEAIKASGIAEEKKEECVSARHRDPRSASKSDPSKGRFREPLQRDMRCPGGHCSKLIVFRTELVNR